MNLAGKPPLGLKAEKAKPDPAYLEKVRALPCCICENWGIQQQSATEAHHPIHDRFSRARVPDRMAIPLCRGHHMGDTGEGKVAIHKNKTLWRKMFGPDHHYIAGTQDKILGGEDA